MATEKYKSALLKIDRAKKHIADLDGLVLTIAPDSYSLRIKHDPQAGTYSVEFESKPLGPNAGLIFGDAVTNIRSALDHCYAAALGLDKEISGQIFFPIRDNRNGLVASMEKGLKKRPVPKPLFDFILNEICSYKDGHKTLPAINKFSNTDKHRLLLAMTGLTGVRVSYRQGNTTFENCIFAVQAGNKINIVGGPGPPEFKSKPEPVLQIQIGEREPPGFYGNVAVPTLLGFAEDVTSIIEAISLIVP